MQNIIVYNQSWEKIGLIDAYISLIWTKRYTSAGDFELFLPFTKRYIDILKTGNYVSLDGAKDVGIYAMIIERIEITQSSEDGITILVTGRSLLSILDRRVLYNEIIATSTNFNFIRTLINDCYGADGLPARRWGNGENETYSLNNLTKDKSLGVHAAGKGENLGKIITQFCEENGIGIDLLRGGDMYNIYVYEYADKSDSIFFTKDLDNLAECKYIQDISDYANVARISSNESYATAPTGVDSTTAPNLTGLNRFEQSFTTDLGGENENYNALQASGTRQLRETQNTESLTADIISSKTYNYGTDYVVGDVVTIKTDFGITATAQISEMTESWSQDGYLQIPTFNNYIVMQQEV